MTREEAIAVLRREIEPSVYEDEKSIAEAIDMAIEALSADAVSLTGTMKYLTKPHNYCEVVRCKDCRWYSKGKNYSDSWALCTVHTGQYISVDDYEFCSHGERR